MSTNTDKTYLPETARKWAIATHLGELRRGLVGYREVEVPLMEAWLRARSGTWTGAASIEVRTMERAKALLAAQEQKP